MRRGSIVQLVALGLAVGTAASAVAVLVPWLPTAASRQAGPIDVVFWLVTAVSILISSVVAAALLCAVVKFRVAPDDDSDGSPIHGHTGLEVVWTAVPALLVTAISVVSGVALARIDHLPARH